VDGLHALRNFDAGGLTPAQSWGPGAHAEGRCGMVSKFDGNRLVLQTPQFICD
jgi:hypothetical protein